MVDQRNTCVFRERKRNSFCKRKDLWCEKLDEDEHICTNIYSCRYKDYTFGCRALTEYVCESQECSFYKSEDEWELNQDGCVEVKKHE